MKLTIEKLKSIYASRDVDLSENDAVIMLEQCNDQDGINGRDSEGWAHFFARQEAYERECDENELRDFHLNAYGE